MTAYSGMSGWYTASICYKAHQNIYQPQMHFQNVTDTGVWSLKSHDLDSRLGLAMMRDHSMETGQRDIELGYPENHSSTDRFQNGLYD